MTSKEPQAPSGTIVITREDCDANRQRRKEAIDPAIRQKGVDIIELSDQLHYPLNQPELLESAARLVLKMGDCLPLYRTILSDEISGRLPALILFGLVNSIRESQGLPTEGFFIASGREESTWPAVGDFIRRQAPTFGRTLVVTEWFLGGGSMTRLAAILKECQIDFDIAALSIAHPPEDYPEDKIRRAYFGDIGHTGHFLFHVIHNERLNYTGVTKPVGWTGAFPKVQEGVDRLLFRAGTVQARRDIRKIVAEFRKLLPET